MAETGIPQHFEIPIRRMPSTPQPSAKPAVLAHGFRIFFLMGAVAAMLLVAAWIGIYAFGVSFHHHMPMAHWHGHEMLFGFAMAIIAGFLLTAPGNWTGRTMPRGFPLGCLAGLWLAGRFAGFFPGILPLWLYMMVDAAFIPVLAVAVYRALRGVPQHRHNLVFPVILLAMTVANVTSHLMVRTSTGVSMGTEGMLYLVLLMITVMGGRVIPGFTLGKFPEGRTRVWPWLDRIAIGSLPVVMLADLAGAPVPMVAMLCLAAAMVHGSRLVGWHTPEMWRFPLVWLLHVGYGWMVLGFIMKAGSILGFVPPLLFRHAFTAGTIGGVIFAMICRVSLGHTGRSLRLPGFVPWAMIMIGVVPVLRVLLPWVAPMQQLLWIKLSGAAWIVAFGVYIVYYAPMLCQPRADGRPG